MCSYKNCLIEAILIRIFIWDFFLGTQEQVQNSRGKRAISVRATEVLLYIAVSNYAEGLQPIFLWLSKLSTSYQEL